MSHSFSISLSPSLWSPSPPFLLILRLPLVFSWSSFLPEALSSSLFALCLSSNTENVYNLYYARKFPPPPYALSTTSSSACCKCVVMHHVIKVQLSMHYLHVHVYCHGRSRTCVCDIMHIYMYMHM